MASYLVISAIGEDKPGIVQKLSQMIVEKNGNITSSRMMAMGGEFSLMLMVEGNDKIIDDIIASLPDMEASLELTITSRKTWKSDGASPLIAYRVEVVSMDHPGIIQQVSDFFSRRDANIEEMNTDTYAAAHTGTTMFSLEMIVGLPAEIKIASLREEFLDFCDNLNL
jgi:glycine cleavage system transcriptional repressor